MSRTRRDRVLIERDLVMTTPDGARLLATRYRPEGVLRGPVVLIRSPYGREPGLSSRTLERPIAAHGYQVVVQSVRGTFGSGGPGFEPGRHERADGAAAVAWLRAQPWCDGRVAMAGGSYLATTQWAAGPVVDPPLDAMAISIGSSSMLAGWYPQGAFGAAQSLRWVQLLRDQERRGGALRIATAGPRIRRALRAPGFGAADEAVLHERSEFYREQVAHVADEDHWAGAVDFREDREGLLTPVAVVTGWHDLFLRQTLDDVRVLEAAGRRPRLTIGPWWHGDLRLLPTAAREALALLDRVWRDEEDGRAPVRVALQGTGELLDLPSWPPPAEPFAVRFPVGGRRRRTLVLDPDDPTPSVGGPGLIAPAGRQVQRRIERRSDVAVLTAPPRSEPLTAVGTPRVAVTVSTDAAHAMLVARLCDVDRRGVSRNLTEGLLLLDGPLDRRRVVVELDPTGFVLRRGHRLRLQLAPGATPRAVLPDRAATTPRYAVTVHAGGDRDPEVLLPVPVA